MTLIKFTRVYRKVPMLHEIDADARFVHIVRDPRLVAASYLFGKNQKNLARFADADAFFGRTSTGSAWSSYPLSEGLLQMPEHARHRGLPDFMRVLLIWKDCFESTRRDAVACFGDRYHLVRHEDLLTEPEPTLERLYGHLGLDVPEHVQAWVRATVHKNPNYYEPDHPAWHRAFEQLELAPSLAAAGYVNRSVTPAPG
jgi:hypothetical protein